MVWVGTGVPAIRCQEQEHLWQQCFLQPTMWWDNRRDGYAASLSESTSSDTLEADRRPGSEMGAVMAIGQEGKLSEAVGRRIWLWGDEFMISLSKTWVRVECILGESYLAHVCMWR